MDDKIELPKIGDIIAKEFLEPLGITPYRLAKDLGLSISSILDLIHNKRKISVEMALMPLLYTTLFVFSLRPSEMKRSKAWAVQNMRL